MEPNELLGLLVFAALLCVMKTGFVGMALLIQNAMPDFVERASEVYGRKPYRWVLLLGLVNGFAIPFIAILLISSEVLALPGLLLLLTYLWLALLSYTVIYREIGGRLFGEFESNHEVKTVAYGGLVAEAAFFTPVLGQLYSLFLFVKSLGAVMVVVLTRRRKA
jgi:hypothetical protein